MAMVLDERIKWGATARERENSTWRGNSATRVESTRSRLTGVGYVGFVPSTGAAANSWITPPYVLPRGYYWLAGLAICIVTWGAVIGSLTHLLSQ